VKVVGWLVGVVLLVVVGVGAYVVMNSGSLIKTAVETLGPKFLGVPVSLGSAEISLTDGSGALNNLVIGNPEGFSGPHAMRIGKVALALDPSQISGDLVVIRDLTVDGAEVAIVAKGTQTNLQTILNNLDSGESAEPAPADDPASEMKMIIDKFAFTNAKTSLSSDLIGDKSVEIPDINLSGIGRKSSGVTAQEAVKQLLQPILRSSTEAVVNAGIDVEGIKQGAMEKVNESVSKGLKGLTERLKN
jgi:hypothetical protein